MKKVELLSPAGDYTCFLAAINAGADAVYLSGEKFGARAYAKNFSTEELISAIDYAHVFNAKVFLTVNTLLKDNELNELYEYLLPFYEAGLDGVIVQDMGVISLIRKRFIDLPVHASTQLAITGIEGINYLEREGVVRTVLAREVSLDEIKYIHSNSNMELECFVHGALCYSYSGKCLFSSLIGGRSGNRGRCAGSCRQPYNDKYLLSTKDICCLSLIPELIEAGIASFKIEGRMKSPEYVAAVTAVYRKYIDLYYDNINRMSKTDIISKFFKGKSFNDDLDLLLRLYTRGGKSEGYYFRHNGKEMISVEDASYKSDKGEAKSFANENYVNSLKKKPINGFIYIHSGEDISLQIYDDDISVTCSGTKALTATNRPLDEDSVKKQLNKIKDTEFIFDNIIFDLGDDAFIRISDLNELRRNALSLYKEELISKYRRTIPSDNNDIKMNSNTETSEFSKNSIGNSLVKPDVNCDICTLDQFKSTCHIKGIRALYVPISLILSNEQEIFDSAAEANKKIYVKFQSVIRYNYLIKNKDRISDILKKSDGVLADSHEVIEFVRSLEEISIPVIGDIHIYVLNNEAYGKYRSSSLSNTTVPVELSKKELLRRNIFNEEMIVYGYLPMMISAQCVNRTISTCDKTAKEIRLTDRKGATFTAVNSCHDCSNTIYNNVPLSLHTEGDFIKKLSPKSIRLNFTLEDSERTSDVAEFYVAFINSLYGENSSDCNKISASGLFKENSYTKGHTGRGVL